MKNDQSTKACSPRNWQEGSYGGDGGTRTAHGKSSPSEEKRRQTDGWGILKNTTNWREWLEGMGKGLIADPISTACYRLEKHACLGQNIIILILTIFLYNNTRCKNSHSNKDLQSLTVSDYQTVMNAGQMGDTWVCFYGTCWWNGNSMGTGMGGGIRGELDPKLVCDNNAPSSYPVPGLGGGTYWTSAPIGRSKEELFYPVQRAAPEKTSRPQVWNRNNHIYVIWYEIQREEEHTLWS